MVLNLYCLQLASQDPNYLPKTKLKPQIYSTELSEMCCMCKIKHALKIKKDLLFQTITMTLEINKEIKKIA